MHCVLNMIDNIANMRFSQTVMAKCEKSRKKQVQEAKEKMKEAELDKKEEIKRE
mgnify:FL=1